MLKRIVKKLLIYLGIGILTVFLLFIFKIPIMKGVGGYLISEDKLQKADVIFVLGGSSFERGNEAAKLFIDGYAPEIICLGKNSPSIFGAINKDYTESEIARINIIKNHDINKRHVKLLKIGTSTKEESVAIADYCRKNKLERIIIISSKFHTRRVRGVFEPLFEDLTTQLIIHGTPSLLYNENEWWMYEQGLLMVNNEYVKLVYYWIKY